QIIPDSSLTGLIRLIADGYSKSGALGDLMLGANARLLQSRPALQQLIGVSSVLTPVRDLEDGYTAFMVTPPSPVRLFHVRLPNHAAIYANGRPVETYHPGKGVEDLLGENMRALFLSLFPDVESFADFGSLAYLRMSKDTLDSLT
ncbi:Hint domain-containing protein, partial [Planktotalea sp.]|uniref:Hint domain-containing protein n=1 Tax=Planktotalea sp. TaxID=2029877 RepID=UPI003299457B